VIIMTDLTPAQRLARATTGIVEALRAQGYPAEVSMDGTVIRVGLPDRMGNVEAREGCSRCPCGCKYWERDRCIDCGASIESVPTDQR
jgi:hypothetical protein